jgi:glycine/serine hydroxymethyltransferase
MMSIGLSCFPGEELMHIIAAKAVAFGEALKDEFLLMLYNCKKMPTQWQKLRKEGTISLEVQTTT